MDARPQPEPQEAEDEAPVRRRRFPHRPCDRAGHAGAGRLRRLAAAQALPGSGRRRGKRRRSRPSRSNRGPRWRTLPRSWKAAALCSTAGCSATTPSTAAGPRGLQYGDFELYPGRGYNDIITALSEQKVRRQTTRVTIPEGTTAVAVAQLFVDQGLVDSVETFLDCANGTDGSDFSQYEFWNQIPDNPDRLFKCEGYLFPETYEFFTDATVYEIVDTLYAQFDAETADLMAHGGREGHDAGRRRDPCLLYSGGGRRAGGGLQGQRLLPQPSGIGRPAVERPHAGIQRLQLYHAGCREQLPLELAHGRVYGLAAGRPPSRRMCSTPTTPTASAACRPGRSPTRALRPLTPRSTRTRSSWPKGYYFFVTATRRATTPANISTPRPPTNTAPNVAEAGW